MVKDVFNSALPVAETLCIRKNEITNGKGGKRLSVVTGIHGDELEGQLLVHMLASHFAGHKEYLNGTISLYPSLNPLGMESITRTLPGFDLDMNRVFPGNDEGTMVEHLAAGVIRDLVKSDIVIDVHASNIFLTEVPQVRVNVLHRERLLPLARKLNVDFVWIHGASTVLESTLAYSLNSRGVDTLVVEMGVGMRLTEAYARQLFAGVLNLMAESGMYTGPIPEEIKEPVVGDDDDAVIYLNAPAPGIFLKKLDAGTPVSKGDLVGQLLNPLEGRVIADIRAPEDGWLFTVREYPLVDEGSLMGRILRRSL